MTGHSQFTAQAFKASKSTGCPKPRRASAKLTAKLVYLDCAAETRPIICPNNLFDGAAKIT
jgi:hypothetical protein